MALNLVKLCVGVSAIEELQAWIDQRMEQRRALGKPQQSIHTTRMVPRRMKQLLDGGSLYWVIKGNVQARQILEDIEVFTDKEGIRRCRLIMEPRLIATHWQPRRAFQGWRYLEQKDAPVDLVAGKDAGFPPQLQRELAELGLL